MLILQRINFVISIPSLNDDRYKESNACFVWQHCQCLPISPAHPRITLNNSSNSYLGLSTRNLWWRSLLVFFWLLCTKWPDCSWSRDYVSWQRMVSVCRKGSAGTAFMQDMGKCIRTKGHCASWATALWIRYSLYWLLLQRARVTKRQPTVMVDLIRI